MGLAASYAGAWQFYLLLLLRILTAILKQPLMDAMAAFAYSEAGLARPELTTALGDLNTQPAVTEQVLAVPLAEPDVNMRPLKAVDECVLTEECIDQYLWSVYERARKVDTIKVQEQIKTIVKKNGKSRSVTKTVTKLVDEDFTWITNSTCFASASAVRQDHPDAWPSWTLRALGHEGRKCWYPQYQG